MTVGVADYLRQRVTRTEPPLWVERVFIFSSLGDSVGSSAIVREVGLKRGLNLVWGKDVATLRRENGRTLPMSGHDVGKTSFCRLVRHLLGERTYGTLEQHKLIAKSFPDGYVGGEIWLRGVRWAVLRPISRGTVSFAGEGMSLDQLMASRDDHRRFEDWRIALGNSLTKGILGFVPDEVSDPSMRWLRILQWCARDERAKYSHVWNWRESDQNNEPGSYQRPAVDGERLIRGTLGLNDDQGAMWDQEIDAVSKRNEKLKDDIERALLEPRFLADEQERWLAEMLEKNELAAAASVEMSFSSLEQKWEREGQAWRRRAAERKRDYDEIVAYLKRRGVEHQEEQDRLSEPTDLEDALAPLIEDEPGEVEKAKALLDRIRKEEREDCDFGGVPYNRCKYVCWNKARKEDIAAGKVIDPQDDRLNTEQSERRAEADRRTRDRNERLAALEQKLKADTEAAEKRLAGLRPIIDRATTNAEQYEVNIGVLRRNRSVWETALAQAEKRQPFPKAQKMQGELDQGKQRLTELVEGRKARLETFAASRKALEALYDGLAKECLSEIHEGAVGLQPDEVDFQIKRRVQGPGGQVAYRGNAAMTLSVVLADVAAMLIGLAGYGSHPGFLLHDSPRQGDLDPEHYWEYLRLMRQASESLGGPGAAPFQYIVTTTTPPPEEVQPLVRLTLEQSDESKLLFGRILGTGGPPEPEQLELIGDDPS